MSSVEGTSSGIHLPPFHDPTWVSCLRRKDTEQGELYCPQEICGHYDYSLLLALISKGESVLFAVVGGHFLFPFHTHSWRMSLCTTHTQQVESCICLHQGDALQLFEFFCTNVSSLPTSPYSVSFFRKP